MCGRIIQASGPLRHQLVDGMDIRDSRLSNIPRRYDGAPSQELLVIRENHETGERSLYLLKWGLVPSWNSDPAGGPKPINAMAETIRLKPMFRRAYGKRRCIVPVDGFFEWQATKGGKQPYAIAMKNGVPFGLAGLWENWKDPTSGPITSMNSFARKSQPGSEDGALLASLTSITSRRLPSNDAGIVAFAHFAAQCGRFVKGWRGRSVLRQVHLTTRWVARANKFHVHPYGGGQPLPNSWRGARSSRHSIRVDKS